MDILSFVLLGVSLSMDALAVAISAGICNSCMRKRDAVKIALYFGGFQALMPVLGWLLGSTVAEYISAFDHWVAFALLDFIGAKMIFDALHQKEGEPRANLLSNKVLLTMAVATSIDALAVGITLGLVDAPIALGASIIGATTFLISFAGAIFGCKLGTAFEKKATIIGGLVLIGLGIKILLEHLLS